MSNPYNFKKVQIGRWETGIDGDKQYGYFEHDQTGTAVACGSRITC